MTTSASIRGGLSVATASKLNAMAMNSKEVGCDTITPTTASANILQVQERTPQTTTTFAASFLLASLALSALPALADLDADGVETPNIITSIFFTIAVALLGVCTLGILYLAAREVRRCPSESRLCFNTPTSVLGTMAPAPSRLSVKKRLHSHVSPSQELAPVR